MQPETPPKLGSDAARMIIIGVDAALISEEALLKTSYWFSRDFACEMHKLNDNKCEVHLTPRGRKLYAEIAPAAARRAQLTVKSLTSAQQKELLAMLRIIIRNLRKAPSIEAEEKAIAQRAR